MDAQQEHDQQMKIPTNLDGSREVLEKLLKAKGKTPKKKKSSRSSSAQQSAPLGIIGEAMRNHPGLTREEAERMLEAFGG